jgi:hypothetical protein
VIARLSLEYGLRVFAAGVGVLQVVAATKGLWGLLFFRRRVFAYIFAFLTITPSLVGFFTWNQRNATGLIQGSEQFGLFIFSMAVAFAFTFFVSSWVNRSRFEHSQVQQEGIEALRGATFLQIMQHRFSKRH